jgi:hypothetical protein
MHWPAPFARGDNMFPKDKDGKMTAADVDYVDVSVSVVFHIKHFQLTISSDLQSNGEARQERQM